MLKIKEGFRGERSITLPPASIRMMEQHPIGSALHITDIGYYPEAAHHFRSRSESISEYILIYCVKGSGWIEVSGNVKRVVADSYFVIPAGMSHSYGSDTSEPWTIYWIHFKGSLAGEFFPPSVEIKEIRPGMRSRIERRIEMFEEILTTLENGFSIENLLYSCSALHHFLGSLRYLGVYRALGGSEENDVAEAAIRYMKENIEKPLRLSDLAAFTGYSSSHFSSLFTKRTGLAPLNYFNQLRIKKACDLLDFTDLKINQLCYKIGISDSYYFSRLFAKIMGISPSEYRRIKKG